jgi:hypothetical protein
MSNRNWVKQDPGSLPISVLENMTIIKKTYDQIHERSFSKNEPLIIPMQSNVRGVESTKNRVNEMPPSDFEEMKTT